MKRTLLAIAGTALLAACQAAPPPPPYYYRVTDPATGKVYYTDSHRSGRSKTGSITFRDAQTGDRVTLQNSEVQRISASEYNDDVDPVR